MKKPLSFSQVQAVWVGAIVFALFCIVFGGFRRKAFHGDFDWRHWLLVVLVAWSAWGGISVRRKLVARATAQSKAVDPTAPFNAWMARQLVGIMSAEGVVLWGIVTNIVIASPQWLSDAFFTLGVLLLFKFIPRRPTFC
jgi:ABC-type Co2+ transport system permease subunit